MMVTEWSIGVRSYTTRARGLSDPTAVEGGGPTITRISAEWWRDSGGEWGTNEIGAPALCPGRDLRAGRHGEPSPWATVTPTRLWQEGGPSQLPVDGADFLAESVEFAPEGFGRLHVRGAAQRRKHRAPF